MAAWEQRVRETGKGTPDVAQEGDAWVYRGSVYLGEIDADDIQVANDDRLSLSTLRSSLIAAHGGTGAAHTLRIYLHLRGNSLCVAGLSHSTWLVTSLLLGSAKMSKYSSPAGDGPAFSGRGGA